MKRRRLSMNAVFQSVRRFSRPIRPDRGPTSRGERRVLLVAVAIGLSCSLGSAIVMRGPLGNWGSIAQGQEPVNNPQPPARRELPPARRELPPARTEQPPARTDLLSSPNESPPPAARLHVGEARRQAELLHEAIHATLQLVHDRYYREDEGLPLPAAVLSNVFADLEQKQHVQLRWLAVEGQAMNTDHKPRNEFELQAVQALKSGKQHYEQAEGGIYRRVGTITLSNHCLKCHVPDRKHTRDRAAGLIISIPVLEE